MACQFTHLSFLLSGSCPGTQGPLEDGPQAAKGSARAVMGHQGFDEFSTALTHASSLPHTACWRWVRTLAGQAAIGAPARCRG